MELIANLEKSWEQKLVEAHNINNKRVSMLQGILFTYIFIYAI